MSAQHFDRRSFLATTTALGAAALLPGCATAAKVSADPGYEEMDGIHGLVEKGWEPVADVFRASFKEGRETGASCCVYVDGRPVVDLWGGLADKETSRPWDRNTVSLVASATKGATAMCAHLLVQRGKLDLDAPVARYWPEFGQAGKEKMPVRYLLSHQSGLPYVDKTISFDELRAYYPLIHALEAQKPYWTPGTEHMYHAVTYGYLVAEVVRRITGKTLGTFFQEEIARPLRLSAWIGLPEAIEPRVARIDQPASAYASMEALVVDFAKVMGWEVPVAAGVVKDVYGPGSEFIKAGQVGNLQGVDAAGTPYVYTRAYRAMEMPSGSMFTNAHSLARMYAATVSEVDGFRLLNADTVAAMTATQTDRSRMHGVPAELLPYAKNLFTMSLGFMRPNPAVSRLLGPASFGHPGTGGSTGAGDPGSRVGFGYVPNRWTPYLIDPRPLALTDAVRKRLGKA